MAFIAGANSNQVELYSPEGKCQHSLAPMPINSQTNVLSLFKNQILSCGGETTKNCYIYFPINNTWSSYANASTKSYYNLNAVYQGKFYLSVADIATPQAEVFDPATLIWTPSWPASPNVNSVGCMVQWEDSFIRFGGQINSREIMRYNITLKTWTSLDSSSMPMDVYRSGCATLPNKKIFILGNVPNYHKYTVYDVVTNSWPIFSQQPIQQYDTSVLVLSNRVFALSGGYQSIIQEYNFLSDTFTNSSFELITQRGYYGSVLAVPAKIFSFLLGGCIGIK